MSPTSAKIPTLLTALAIAIASPAAVYAARSLSADHGGADVGHEGRSGETTHAHARERTSWPAAQGTTPSSPNGLREIDWLRIDRVPDASALSDLGIEIPGTGTFEDPYVIEGLFVRYELELKDTDAFYVLRENWIGGELRLNWNADKVHVHHNYVNDLRVNENVERTGDATGGLTEQNRFGVVGQIRHFDGVFRANEVGPAPRGPFRDVIEDSGELVPWFRDSIVLNIDGFSGAVFEDNAVVGYVEMQIHGHHHASCFDCHSHNHGDSAKAAEHDHSIRYHEGSFRNNVVTVERGVALRYTDQAHAGDDRTAASEPEESLDAPHTHYSDVVIEGNQLSGPLVVDVFNADDWNHETEDHEHTGDATLSDLDERERLGALTLRGNVMAFALGDQTLRTEWFGGDVLDGILVRDAKDGEISIEENRVAVKNGKQGSALTIVPLVGGPIGGERPAGIALIDLRLTHVLVTGNVLDGSHFGILARRLDGAVAWDLSGNEFRNVERDVDHDASVAHSPDS